ncbi:hypothetical protein KS4_30140 [Poriferisphaera corsica]|uniref:Uncharacterized protein n=1 Tax=Poriferisphaera corsica TaxID=2528020 RepID=A0A517YXI7_9BACT|nr:hypothetical protein [Poriferisphaera corsica]QDU34937.1 hypothetical protein KS4_30140 [Poriferisphaera corsica]
MSIQREGEVKGMSEGIGDEVRLRRIGLSLEKLKAQVRWWVRGCGKRLE